MKLKLLYLFTLILSFSTLAGDTTVVRIHDQTDMTWYGNYDEWGVLPDNTYEYRKVYLHYKMGCATGGCSDWDYTSQIFIRHRTGEIDSTIQTGSYFTVNSNTPDSVLWNVDSTYITFWDTASNNLDSMLSESYQILLNNYTSLGLASTDTLYGFASGFYNYTYDALGNIIDSNLVAPDSTLHQNYYSWYNTFDVIEDYEIARVITPYANGFSSSWEFTHTFDITDFQQILRDSVEIRCHYSGWSSGFSATLDFEFIEGTPPRDVVKLENIYSGGYNYVSSADFENTKLIPKTKHIKANTSGAMVKMTSTGHGFDNNQSAAEFKPINYFVNIDGLQTHTQFNWDSDCGENPIYPQPGTWLYDRANWCPGKKAQTFEHEITPYITPGDSINIDIDFQAYSWAGTQTPSYIIQCQLFQYESPNFNNSAEILDIIKPSLKDEWSRKNPICGNPLIKIRNYGEQTLTSLEIVYKVVGGAVNSHFWTGNLDFMQTEEIELPNLSSWAGTDNVFEVTLVNPNGSADDYSENNTMFSEFETVPQYPETFALWVGTNSGVINSFTQESETTWDFYDATGNIVHTSGSLYANIQYRDTLTFSAGCYTFVLEDTDEDGLNFWANNDGSGMVRFREIGASWLKSFNADFGTNIVHQFMIGGAQSISSSSNLNTWKIFPTPTKDIITVEGSTNEDVQVWITDNLGKIILRKKFTKMVSLSEAIDISHLKNGVYLLNIISSKEKIVKKIVKQ